jgi:hypothetical protein
MEHMNQHVPGMREALEKGLTQPVPEQPRVTVWSFVSEEAVKGLAERREKRLCGLLGKAILSKDLNEIRSALDKGATHVDMTNNAQTFYGAVPLERLRDPMEFAQHVGLPKEAMEVLSSRLDSRSPKTPSSLP